jgi:hypothetical protein
MAAARLIGMLADWISDDATLPLENREALRATIVAVGCARLSDAFGGEQLRLYVPKPDMQHRIAREARITAAVSAGEAPNVIAKREKVTARWVRKVRGRIGTGGTG